jgi:zinc protease
MKKWLFLLPAVLLMSTALVAQTRKIQFEKYTLPNGLTVILHQDNSAPVVAVTALYHVGSKNEDTGRTGFAHFFEHLLFEGSENIKRGEFDKYISNAGGFNNANTSQDRTFYYELFPSNQLELGLWMESERMMHAKIEQVGVNTQREVVKEEKRQRIDNAVLSIAGDFNIPKTKELIAAYFAPIPKGIKPINRPTIVEPSLGGEVRDKVEDNIQLPAVIQAYRAPKQGSAEYYAFNVLSTLLSGGESSRMSKTLVDEKEIAVAAFAIPLFAEDAGLFLTYALPNIGFTAEALEASMDSVINELKVKLVSEKEFQKVQNQIESNFVSANSTMAGIAESLANYQVYFGDANLINTELLKYKKVTRQDLMNVAKKYFNKDNRVVLYYVPKGSK